MELKEMGIWDYISGTTDSLKRNAPDLTPLNNWCSTSYGYSKATVSNIGGTVKVNANQVLNQYWPNEETRSKIGLFVTSVAKYSAEEGLKFVPGGDWGYKVLKKSYNDVKKSEAQTVDVKALQAKVGLLEKEVDGFKKIVEKMHHQKKPEAVIRVFMMKKFMGRQLLDDPIVTPKKK